MENSAQEQPWRLRVLMEPRGFIKILEFVLAVCMFATTAGYGDVLKYSINCNNTAGPHARQFEIAYPFELNKVLVPGVCTKENYYLGGDASGAAKFFVCIGVLAFLYIIAITVWYVFLEHKHLNWDMVPMADFVIHCIFTLFFFIASCVWAAGVDEVKAHTDFDNIQTEVLKDDCMKPYTCSLSDPLSFASLNVSLLFGFLNAVVWGGNCWFVYKETSLFGNKRDVNNTEAEKNVDVPTKTI